MYAQAVSGKNRNVGRSRRRKRQKRRSIAALFFLLVLGGGFIWRLAGNVGSLITPGAAVVTKGIDISGEVRKGSIPLFLQTDSRWGNRKYGGDTMAVTGCGPTCLSMVYCGLTGDDTWNPYELAKKAERDGYYVRGSGSLWSMMTELAQELGLEVVPVRFEERSIRAELERGNPIICIMGAGDFTTTGHFIVLTGVDREGEIIVRDPNSESNSRKGWELSDLMSQMKNLWGYTYHS